MIVNIKKFLLSDTRRSFFLSAVTLAITYGFVTGWFELKDLKRKRELIPFSFYGNIFYGLNTVLKDEKYIGYYTDKNIQEPKYGAQFEQTQLALAPLILDLNSTDRRFTIFDCLDTRACIQKISAINAQPLKITNQGIILTVKK